MDSMRKLSMLALAAVVAAPSVLSAQGGGREVVMTPGRGGNPSTGSATLSNVIKVPGGVVFASGQLPAQGDSTIEGQTTSVLNRIKALFEAAGTSMNNAVKCTVFLLERSDFQGMNSAYQKFWSPENPPPARSTIVVKELVAPGKLEIECIAAMPKG
jgi:2-iminobutanoate/2-iminopropanoate deaminase